MKSNEHQVRKGAFRNIEDMIEEIKQSDPQSSSEEDEVSPEDHDVGGVSDELTE